MRKLFRTYWVWVVVIFLFTTWLGVRGLQVDAINYDEHWTIRIIAAEPYGFGTLPELFANAAEDPWQPPLYYISLWGWSQFVGATPFALRFLTTLIGLVSVASAYRLGSVLFSKQTGLYAASLLGASSLLAIYLHELRPYALYVLFTILALWAYWQALRVKSFSWREGLFLFVAIAGLIYSHYFSIVLIVAVGLYHLIFVTKNRIWWRITAICLGAGATFLLWLPVMFQAIGYTAAGGREGTTMKAGEVLVNATYAVSNGWLPALGIGVLVLLGLRQGRVGRFLGFVTLVTLALALVINAVQPILTHVRYIIPLLPLILTLAAGGLLSLGQWHRALPVLVLIGWFGVSFANTTTTVYEDTIFRDIHIEIFRPHLPVHEMTDWLQEKLNARDAVIFHVPQHPWAVAGAFEYGMYGAPGRYIILDQLSPEEDSDFSASASDYLVGAGRVWIALETSDTPLETYRELLAVLDQNRYQPCHQYNDLDSLEITLYARYELYCDLDAEALVHFSDEIALTGYLLPDIVTGGSLRLPMTWGTENAPANTYSVALHLEDSAGEIVAQRDVQLPLGASAYRTTVMDVSEVEDGEYTLLLTVYEWNTGERLNADTNADDFGRTVLGTVQIERLD